MRVLAFAVFLLLCVVFTVAAPVKKDSLDKKAVLLLDGITFPKIVPNSDHDVIVLVSLKTSFGDYGTDSMRTDYFNFALRSQTQGDGADHVIFAQVVVNGAENRQLAESIGVSENFQHPQMFIFPAGSKTAIKFPAGEPFEISTMTRFAAQHSSLQFQLPGTMKKFDEIVASFMATDATHQAALLHQAEQALEELTNEGEIETANYYLKTMRRVEEQGVEYIEKEIKRQTRILNDASKMTKAKQRLIQYHLNVLHHFKASIPSRPVNDEL